MNPTVSIIIVNYNTEELTLQCIRSIYTHISSYSFEIIVVDNNSQDNSVSSIQKNFPEVIIIQNKENVGFGRANNIGMQIAKGKYFFLLNSDTIILNDIFSFFVPFMEKPENETIGVIGAFLQDQKNSFIHSGGNFPSLWQEIKTNWREFLIHTNLINPFRIIKHRLIGKPIIPQFPTDVIEVEYITGADMFIRREIYDTIGGFDPQFFLYYEETDWQYQMAKIGWKRVLIPGPKIIHLEGQSSKPKNIKSLSYMKISSLKFMKKNSGICSYLLLKINLLIIALLLFLLSRNYTISSKFSYIKAILKENY
mgnify:CR=1 FL=1